MNFQTAVNQATAHLLKSKKARTYQARVFGKTETCVLELERTDPYYLTVTTWGFDYEEIRIPGNRSELIEFKCLAQMASPNDCIAQVELRYYLDILRRESK